MNVLIVTFVVILVSLNNSAHVGLAHYVLIWSCPTRIHIFYQICLRGLGSTNIQIQVLSLLLSVRGWPFELSWTNFSASEFCWQIAPTFLQHLRLCQIQVQVYFNAVCHRLALWTSASEFCWQSAPTFLPHMKLCQIQVQVYFNAVCQRLGDGCTSAGTCWQSATSSISLALGWGLSFWSHIVIEVT